MFSIKKNPIVKELALKKEYRFMYEGFLVSTQSDLYLLLEENDDVIDTLLFPFLIYKFGYPNDEAAGANPMAKFGLGFYGIFEVFNSPWIDELKISNRIHNRHTDDMYKGLRHIIICYKDNTLEVVCQTFEEIVLNKQALLDIVSTQIAYIANKSN